jgi:Bardet-Biedl syndrome 1 protein
LKSVPVFINANGTLEIDYRIFIACRNGRIYQYRAGKISDHVISIESKPVGLVKFEKSIVVAGMDNSMQCFYFKGKKNWSVSMPAEICSITKMEHSKAPSKNNVLVAMINGTIRLYNEKNLINEITTEDTCNGIVYGVFGREDGCLVINHQSGGMQAKILARQANLTSSTIKAGAAPEQDVPLKVPQKTTLFVELTQRERE